MTVANGIPVIGGQDFADRNPNEQNVLRAMWLRLRKLDAVLTLAAPSSPDATDLASAITLVNELKSIVTDMLSALNDRTTV